MITILTYVSLITGGLLILLLLISVFSGLDLDFDIGGDTSVDTDAGGLGVFKSLLTFVSVCSWVIKIALTANQSPLVGIGIGIIVGGLSLWLLNALFKLLIRNEENVNWSPEDAIFKEAKVYLKIPKNGSGIIHLNINGAVRELKAKTTDKKDIATGDMVYVKDYTNGFAIVTKDTNFSI